MSPPTPMMSPPTPMMNPPTPMMNPPTPVNAIPQQEVVYTSPMGVLPCMWVCCKVCGCVVRHVGVL